MRKQLIFKNLMMLFVVASVSLGFISCKKDQKTTENKSVCITVQENKTRMEENVIVPCRGKSC
ncbi:hypothetical protein LY11_02943 [Pedobacter cryoconitis]|uniref:Lipoprotein n=1 Tax=Pedobacter cryoconitis TaxID=188932 RepID=A0A327SJQ2_9SPHI|nr:hypothetical protein LY11_02943 [Pedobacter cryoconitis]